MSWSVMARGTKEHVAEQIATQLDGCLRNYPAGTAEGADIEACKGRILALVESLRTTEKDPHVKVSANGSHSTYDGGISSASFSVTIGICAAE